LLGAHLVHGLVAVEADHGEVGGGLSGAKGCVEIVPAHSSGRVAPLSSPCVAARTSDCAPAAACEPPDCESSAGADPLKSVPAPHPATSAAVAPSASSCAPWRAIRWRTVLVLCMVRSFPWGAADGSGRAPARSREGDRTRDFTVS